MKYINRFFLAFAALVLMASCSTFNDDSNPYDVEEAVKDMSGIWKLKTVTRNGVDITKSMDFTRFQLQLNSDGSYHIQNYLPFVVNGSGTWSVNDPKHPMLLSFMENGASEAISLDFNYPVVNGDRAISITLSPGCYSNTYVYTLYHESNE
ncbi:MAG: DUF5004 domain-containing protein [Prevotella sp.]|nr:DUF5004 domain-containing protein [Prevotella sp.]